LSVKPTASSQHVARACGVPRLTRVAGFEWGTGFYINPVPPEQSAAFLREVQVDLTTPPRS